MATDWGKMAHYWAETGEFRGPDRRTENAFRKAVEISGIDRESYWPSGGNHEGALSLSLDGTRQANRDDSERDGWLTGHYDYTHWLVDGQLWIDDLKTGKLYPNPAPGYLGHMTNLAIGENRFPPSVTSPQMKMYALGLSKLLSYDGPVLVSLTHWPRLPLTARHALPTRTHTEYTKAELAKFWRDLELMYSRAQHNERAFLGLEEELRLQPGEHCKFCPVRDCLFQGLN